MVVDGFQRQVEEAVKVDWLTEWVSLVFSTTNAEDNRAAIVLVMGMMKRYFRYTGGIICGIPSITLLGTKADRQRLVDKTDRPRDFGSEPGDYACRLRRVLTRIVTTFDGPHDAEIKTFWDWMVQAKVRHSITCGEPPIQYMVSGWMLALFYWNKTDWRSNRLAEGRVRGTISPGEELACGGMRHGETTMEALPLGYAKAKFNMLNSSCNIKQGYILGGNIGKRVMAESPEGYGCRMQPPKFISALHFSQTAGPTHIANGGAVESQSKRDSVGCQSGLLHRRNCFRGREEMPAEMWHRTTAKENLTEKSRASRPGMQYASHEQSTIQPLSGWFVSGL